jgi:hypothetical protein
MDYYPPIVRALTPLSLEKDDFKLMLREWTPLHRETTDEQNKCPCGVAIKELCWITNVLTKATLFVGNECVKHVTEEMPYCARCKIYPIETRTSHFCHECRHNTRRAPCGYIKVGKFRGTAYDVMWRDQMSYCNWVPPTFSDRDFLAFVKLMQSRHQ